MLFLQSPHFLAKIRGTLRPLLDFFRTHKFIAFGIADIFLITASLFLAFLIRFEGRFPIEYHDTFFLAASALVLPTVFFIARRGLYAFNWTFVGLHELINLLKALSLGGTVFAAIIFLDRDATNIFAGFPRSIIIISFVLNLLFLGGIRISKRAWREVVRTQRGSINTPRALIVGAGQEGEQFIRNIIAKPDQTLVPIGIVDNASAHGTSIHGVRVLGTIADIPRLAKEYDVEYLVVALAAADGETIREAVRQAREAHIANVKIIPGVHEILSGRVTLTDLRGIQIEDLLGRNPAKLETEKISEFLRDKIVLITGAAGSIGTELARQTASFQPQNLLLLDFNETGLFDIHQELQRTFPNQRTTPIVANVTNRKKIFTIFKIHEPHIVFHAAAYKHVPLMEAFPDEAIRTNIFGTLNVAEAAIESTVEKFILVSTDKAIRPISIMGKTKRAAELIIQGLNEHKKTKFAAVRFGNVIGSRGSVVPIFQEQIKHRAPITVTHPDMARYFMTIPEAVLLIMEAGAVGNGGEIFMLDMGEPVKIVDMAREMIRLAGLKPDVDIPIVFTGIRPGEKLYEEIFSKEEKRVGATQWDKIFITKSEHAKPLTEIRDGLTHLTTILSQDRDDEAPSELQRLITPPDSN